VSHKRPRTAGPIQCAVCGSEVQLINVDRFAICEACAGRLGEYLSSERPIADVWDLTAPSRASRTSAEPQTPDERRFMRVLDQGLPPHVPDKRVAAMANAFAAHAYMEVGKTELALQSAAQFLLALSTLGGWPDPSMASHARVTCLKAILSGTVIGPGGRDLLFARLRE
jgi:hypothetical protein